MYSRPNPSLLRLSVNTLWSCEYEGDAALRFIDVKIIQSMVAMVPHTPAIEGVDLGERFFLVEKPGFDVAIIAGIQENLRVDENIEIDSIDN